jgi:hypothetical protein
MILITIVCGSSFLSIQDDYPYDSGSSGERGFCIFQKKKAAAHISGWSYTTPVCADFACNKQGMMDIKLNIVE